MRAVSILCLILAMGSVNAQTLYKCVSKKAVMFQQQPCPALAKTVRTMETAPEPAPTPEQLRAQDDQFARGREESAYLSHLAGTDQHVYYPSSGLRWSPRDQQIVECNAQKAYRANALQVAGPSRTIELLQHLDDSVAHACSSL